MFVSVLNPFGFPFALRLSQCFPAVAVAVVVALMPLAALFTVNLRAKAARSLRVKTTHL